MGFLKQMRLLLVLLLWTGVCSALQREVGSGQTFTTIQACLTAASSGDICNVHTGTYSESPNFPRAGITLQRNASDVVLVLGSINLQAFGVGTVVDGFQVAGFGTTGSGTWGIHAQGTSGFIIRNNEVGTIGANTAYGDGIDLRTVSNFQVYGNKTHDLQEDARTGNSGPFWGMGLIVYGCTATSFAQACILHDNEVYQNVQDGINFSGTYFKIYSNYVHDNIIPRAASEHEDGIECNGDIDCNHILIYNNIVKNHTQNIYVTNVFLGCTSCGDVWIWNNTVYNDAVSSTGVNLDTSLVQFSCTNISLDTGSNAHIFNNTLGHTSAGCQDIYIFNSFLGTEIKNNIFNNPGGSGVVVDQTANLASGTLNYNVYNVATSGGNGLVKWGGSGYLTTIAAVRTTASQEANGSLGNPNVNTFSTQPSLKATSTLAVNLGLTLTDTNGYGLATDAVGVTRPVGTAWDVGAFEFPYPTCLRSFYIDSAAAGDTANGTDKATPWKRAPGMKGFTGTYTHAAGDCFLFKGGTTWLAANWRLLVTGSGTSLRNDVYGADRSWYAGTTWTRPVADAQNAHIDATHNVFFDLRGSDFITVDWIEFTNFRATNWSSFGECAMIEPVGDQNITIDHIYAHNMHIDAASDTNCFVVEGATFAPYQGNGIVRNSLFVGDGTTYGSAIHCFGNVRNNIVHDMIGQVFPCGHGEISGNLLYNCGYPSFPAGGSLLHADAIQADASDGTFYIHDNVIHDTGNDAPNGSECEAMLIGNGGETDYVWNNVLYNIHGNAFSLVQCGPTGPGCPGPGIAAYFWNNTVTGALDGANYCVRAGHATNGMSVIEIRNNHCITSAGRIDDPALVATTVTVNSNLTQTSAQASAQGYTAVQAPYVYFPTTGGATIGQGVNLTSNCTGTNSGLCSDTGYASTTATGNVVSFPTRVATARPGGAVAWDIGAYMFQSGGLNRSAAASVTFAVAAARVLAAVRKPTASVGFTALSQGVRGQFVGASQALSLSVAGISFTNLTPGTVKVCRKPN